MQGSDPGTVQDIPGRYPGTRQHGTTFCQINGKLAHNEAEANDFDESSTRVRDLGLTTATISVIMCSAFFGFADKRN